MTKHYHNHYRFSYTTSFKRHFLSLFLILFLLFIIVTILFKSFSTEPKIDLNQISLFTIIMASFSTVFRLTIAYLISLVFAIPISLGIVYSPKVEKIMLPIVDIIQSIPVLAFFPIIVLAFVSINFYNGAAIFILFMSMIWNIVFSMIGGLKTIPEDINNASKIFGAKGIKKIIYVTIPAIFPSIATGSFLAWGQGWNISIVAEALHTFIPNGNPSNDLLGLGSLLVDSFSKSRNSVFIMSLLVMVLIITLFNFFVWQKVLKLAERFKFD